MYEFTNINRQIAKVLSIATLTIGGALTSAYALPTSHYASSSALASGNWQKIRVSSSGMQFVSNQQLSQMGFSDPSKVNVYGFGGRLISEVLNANQPDDLPILPSVRTSEGILFFGVDHIDWNVSTNGRTTWTHIMQPYSENSYYFLSDKDTQPYTFPISSAKTTDTPDITDFTERLVHEQDLFAPSVTGRNLLGEDMRNGSTLSLSFPLTGNTDGNASVFTAFGSNITGSAGSLSVSSNGRVGQNSIVVPVKTSTSQFMNITLSKINVSNCGSQLRWDLTFHNSGALSFARLDYVEVEYQRSLALSNGQLYFYFKDSQGVVEVKGCSAETQIWDVTLRHKPVKIDFTLNGNTAVFTNPSGNHEYIAFNPSQVRLAPTIVGDVANQDLHSLPAPDLLIITPPEYARAAQKLATFHRENDGMLVHVLDPQVIYNEFSSGNPDVSAFRKILKMWYDRGLASEGSEPKTKYCLMMGRGTYDNKMVTQASKQNPYPRLLMWQSATGYTESTSYSCDDFIGILDDTKGSVLAMTGAQINVAVGRFPVRSAQEANNAVNKVINFVKNPIRGPWRNNVTHIADDQDRAAHLKQTHDSIVGYRLKSLGGDRFNADLLYFDAYERVSSASGYKYPDVRTKMLASFDNSAITTYIGHANTVSWSHESVMTWSDIISFENKRTPLLFAATCEFARWDADDYSGAEVMWAYPSAGIIACICPSRSVYIATNGRMAASAGQYLFSLRKDGTAPTLGEAYMNMKNSIHWRGSSADDNKLRFVLMGDPAMKMPIPEHIVETTSIKGVELAGLEAADYPVVEARTSPVFKGKILNPDGSVAIDFNGRIYASLYDAETAITTHGWSEPNEQTGLEITYNDHKDKLYDGIGKVENGQWEVKTMLPLEIINNFTPARIVLYAVADDGREGSGACQQFYIYGVDPNAPVDNKAPEILHYTLNNDNFSEGDLINETPVVLATVYDESGINISSSGIGHEMMIVIDRDIVLGDISSFYTPDNDVPGKGHIVYPLPTLTPGKHTATFSVWDNAANSSYATIEFNVAASKEPEILDLNSYYNQGHTALIMSLVSDRAMSVLNCKFEVFDLNGKPVWEYEVSGKTDEGSSISAEWDLHSNTGSRVNRGIYIYRATIETPQGKSVTKSKKIAVSAPDISSSIY